MDIKSKFQFYNQFTQVSPNQIFLNGAQFDDILSE